MKTEELTLQVKFKTFLKSLVFCRKWKNLQKKALMNKQTENCLTLYNFTKKWVGLF